MSILDERPSGSYGAATLLDYLDFVLNEAEEGQFPLMVEVVTPLGSRIRWGKVPDLADAKDTDSSDTTDDLDLSDVDLIDYWFSGCEVEHRVNNNKQYFVQRVSRNLVREPGNILRPQCINFVGGAYPKKQIRPFV